MTLSNDYSFSPNGSFEQNFIDSKPKQNFDFNTCQDSNEQMIYQHISEIHSFLLGLHIDFSKTSTLNSPQNTSILYSLIESVIKDFHSYSKSEFFDISSNDKTRPSIDKIYKELSLALYVAFKTSQDSYNKCLNHFSNLQKQYDDLLFSMSHNSNSSNLESLDSYNSNNEILLKSMTTKFDQLSDEMHQMSMKSYDQESEIERLKQEKMSQELEIDGLKKQLKQSKENSMQSYESLKMDNFKQSASNYQSPDSNNYQNKIFILENDVTAQQIKINELTESHERQKAKIALLVNINKEKETQLKETQDELSNLRLKYEQVIIQQDEKEMQMKQLLSDMKEKEKSKEPERNQIQDLNNAIDELSKQMNQMNQEIAFECESKNKLFKITQEQEKLLMKQDEIINEQENKIKIITEQNTQFKNISKQSPRIELSQQNDNQDQLAKLEDEILKFLSENLGSSNISLYNKLNTNNETQKQCQNSIESRILSLIRNLIKENTDILVEIQNNDMSNIHLSEQALLSYIANLLSFIEMIANSDDVQSWLINTDQIDRQAFRKSLLKQCSMIDSFLKENDYEEYDENNHADFLKITDETLEKIYVQNPTFTDYEVILKMFVTSNDFLRRFSSELKSENERILNEMQKRKSEVSPSSDSTRKREVRSSSNSIQNEVSTNEELRIEKLKNYLKKQRSSLIKTGQKKSASVEIINNCLHLIHGDEIEENSEDENDGLMVQYVSKLEKKIHKLQEANISLMKKINRLKQSKEQQKKEFEQQVEGSKKSSEDLSTVIIDKDKSISHYEELISQKNDEINRLKQIIKENEKKSLDQMEDLKKEIAESQNVSDTHLQSLKEEKNKEMSNQKETYENMIQELNQKIKDNTIQYKSEKRRIQEEADAEIAKLTEMKQNFEEMAHNLKNKLKELRVIQNETQNEKSQLNQELNGVKTEVSKLRIENKMLNLKLQTNFEKFKREIDLQANQTKLNIQKIGTEKEKSISEIRNSYEDKFHQFLLQIFEIFGDFTRPDKQFAMNTDLTLKPISKETAIELMKRVNDTAKQLAEENSEYKSQLDQIKESLKIDPNSDGSIAQILSTIEKTKDSNSSNPTPTIIVTPSNKVDWESWARRLHSIVTDSFCTMKTEKQLQLAIEEELLQAINQRTIFEKVEILRSEKLFLYRIISNRDHSISPEVLTPQNNGKMQSILPVIAILISIRRIQKLSGHLKLCYGISTIQKNDKQNENNNESTHDDSSTRPNEERRTNIEKKRYPILNFYD